MVWEGSKSKAFSVKSFSLMLSQNNRSDFLWKTLWKSVAPSRVAFFVWEAANEAILTEDNLRTRRKIYVNLRYV